MGFRFRKSTKIGPARINISNKGIGWSIGSKGVRYTKRTDGKTQTTLNVPGTGISYVKVNNSSKKSTPPTTNNDNNNTFNASPNNNEPQIPFYKKTWFMWVMLFCIPPVGILLMWLYNNYKKIPKIALSIFFGAVAIVAYTGSSSTPAESSNTQIQDQQVSSAKTEDANSKKSIIEEPKLTGWQTIDNKTYYYDDNGSPKTGWLEVDEQHYYLDDTGVMQTGWVQDSNEYYYCNSDGLMQTGWIQDEGNWYYLNSDGTMAKDISLDGYTISSNGVATKEVVQATQNTSTSSGTSSNGTTTYDPAANERTVYWTPGGKSYHYSQSCPTLARSKTIKSGPGSTCPKSDPCDKCVH